MTLRLAKFVIGSTLLTSFAYGQASFAQGNIEPASSGIVSPAITSSESETVKSSRITTAPEAASSPSITAIDPEPIKPVPMAPEDEDAAIVADPASLIPDLPPVPHAKTTMVGGTLERLDRVQDRITIQVFGGGGRVSALYDPRTHVYRGTKEATIADLKKGERVYLDTILDGSTVFARSIRLSAAAATGESQGIVLRYRSERGELTMRDGLSPNSLDVRVTSSTKFMQGTQTVSSRALVPGSLVAVTFDSEGNGHNVAREISILALPGTHYSFSGQVIHIDLRRGLLVLNSSTDHKTYEIYLNPTAPPDDNLHPGAMVTVDANFQDSRYTARNVTINSQGK